MRAKPLLVLACVAAVLLVAYVALLTWPTGPIGPASYKRICLGMTEQEVKEAIGIPPGYYYSGRLEGRSESLKGGPWLTPIIDEGLSQAALEGRDVTWRSWFGNRYTIQVAFDQDGKAIRRCLDQTHQPEAEPLLDFLHVWLGL